MKRKIREATHSITPVSVAARFAEDPQGWFADQARAHGLKTLLAHADDGVIWGTAAGDGMQLSGDAFPEVSPPLRAITLQQARLFGPQAELLVWRDGDGEWRARMIDDGGEASNGWCFDEPHLQWGDHKEAGARDFTLVADGQEGLRHAVPLKAADIPFGVPGHHPLYLRVRHYLEQDQDDGRFIIAQSRLVELCAGEWKEQEDE